MSIDPLAIQVHGNLLETMHGKTSKDKEIIEADFGKSSSFSNYSFFMAFFYFLMY